MMWENPPSMHYEVEQKFPVHDLAAIEAQLVALGARLGAGIEQLDRYFAHPCRDFARTDEALRIRQVGPRCFVTYKGPKIDPTTKTRREIELPLSDAPEGVAQWTALLEALGFQPVAEVRKSPATGASELARRRRRDCLGSGRRRRHVRRIRTDWPTPRASNWPSRGSCRWRPNWDWPARNAAVIWNCFCPEDDHEHHPSDLLGNPFSCGQFPALPAGRHHRGDHVHHRPDADPRLRDRHAPGTGDAASRGRQAGGGNGAEAAGNRRDPGRDGQADQTHHARLGRQSADRPSGHQPGQSVHRFRRGGFPGRLRPEAGLGQADRDDRAPDRHLAAKDQVARTHRVGGRHVARNVRHPARRKQGTHGRGRPAGNRVRGPRIGSGLEAGRDDRDRRPALQDRAGHARVRRLAGRATGAGPARRPKGFEQAGADQSDHGLGMQVQGRPVCR